MGDNLPLIPAKSAACTDVRSVLRTVFKELDCLPPLSENKPTEKTDWPEKYDTECKEICNQENEIKYQRGKRIIQEPLPNIFKLHEPKADKPFSKCRLESSLLHRKDLSPAIENNVRDDGNLWIKNILNVSSCDASTAEMNTPQANTIITSELSVMTTLQTLSTGHMKPRPITQSPRAPPPSVSVEYIICVPLEVNFLNCSMGRLYVKHIRLINVSKFEWRLSITPPKRNEFKVVINSSRGLTITSGANVDLSVQFTPTEVRTVTDTLRVRVSCGQVFEIPITCHMQPPVLNIVIPMAHSFLIPTAEQISCATLCYNREGADDVVEMGARLLGDVHSSYVLLHCDAEHVKFFVLTENAWIDWNLNGHKKDYDICSDDDSACKYYVNLGTSFPHRSLSTTVKLINCSPIVYSFYWDLRRWGVCSCWEEEIDTQGSCGSDDSSGRLCPGAIESKHMSQEDPEVYARKMKPVPIVKVEPSQDQIFPSSTYFLQVQIPDVGENLGVRRSVLRLILKDIPKESIPTGYESIILKTTEVTSIPIKGLKSWVREVCEILLAEMEVWWEVVPVRFILEPPVIPIYHSRRLSSIKVYIGAIQLFGRDEVCASWVTPPRVSKPLLLQTNASQRVTTCFELPLTSLPNQYPEIDVFTLVSENNEWKAECVVTRQCETRHPSIQPINTWLGIVTPKTPMRSVFSLKNNTYQQIRFRCKAFRWYGENPPSRACMGREPCKKCMEVACTCSMLTPDRGSLAHGESTDIFYNVNAPERDGCVATLLQVRRCEAGLSMEHAAPATAARAVLVAYRVLAPRLSLRVLPCGGPSDSCHCELDPGVLKSELGTSTLRPSKALVVGRRTCYRLRVNNITPLPTRVHFNEPIDGTDFLKVTFIPNEFRLRSYGEVNVKVIVTALRLCERRIFVYRAEMSHSHKPIYVVIDAAVAGVEVSVQVPIGKDIATDDFVIMRRTQRAEQGLGKSPSSVPQDIFIAEDQKRAFVKANLCRCHIHMQYIPRVKRPSPPREENEYTSIDIVTEPPPLTPVCCCFPHTKPFLPEPPQSISLEFTNVPLRKVCERRIILRNESVVTVHWSTAFRRWPRPRQRKRTININQDKWADEVCESGVALACSPASGVLASHAHVEILVQVYANCWGLYHDQVLIKVEDVEPIVLDVWIHVEGPPLQFKIQPKYTPCELPTIWLSPSDLTRSLIVKNVSRSELLVNAYITLQNERVQDVLPFRLYMRLYDILPITCPCVTAYDSAMGEQSTTSTLTSCSDVNMDTGVELYLAPDHGPQNNTYYKVTPELCSMEIGETMKWEVNLEPRPSTETASDCILILQLKPCVKFGDSWYRDEPAPQLVQLRQVVTQAQVKLSCNEIVVKICVLDLPYGDYLRIRKRFQVLNVGNDNINVSLKTCSPWCVVQGRPSHYDKDHKCAFGCEILPRNERRDSVVNIDLPLRSSTEVCVEVCISTQEAWSQREAPANTCEPPLYSPGPIHRVTTPLFVYDDAEILMKLPLIVEMEYPEIKIEPECLDFGIVTDGDSRKTYFSISHTSSTKTLTLAVQWIGDEEFEIWPHFLDVSPGCSEQVYIQYTAVFRRGLAQGSVEVTVWSGAGECACPLRAALCVRAAPARDHTARAAPHDHTDDPHLLPRSLQEYSP